MNPEPNREDLVFLKDCTKHSSYDEKAQIWRDYQRVYLSAMEKAKKSGEPEYKLQNMGRFAANSFIREKANRRKEILSSL